MSWVFGFSGNIDEQRILRLSSLFPTPLIKFRDRNLFLAAGGNEFTCLFSEEKKWIVLGSGIEAEGHSSQYVNKMNWGKNIEANSFDKLEGHYLILKWENETINFYCDRIGLRTIYFLKQKSGIYFSTNPEWITSIMGRVEIDFKVFGSRWLTFNQLSNDSFLYDVIKLPPASSAIVTRSNLKINTGEWFPEIRSTDPDSLFAALRKFLYLEIPEKLDLSFGLSGGLDSRFLLSMLLKDQNHKFKIHSYGNPIEADFQIAKKISDELSLNCSMLQPGNTRNIGFFNKCQDYISASQLIEPVSLYLKLSVFDDNYFGDKFLIDGALAEFARRQFLNRLLIKGRKSLIKKDYHGILDYLMVSKPAIFKEEYIKIMLEGAVNQLIKIFETFPDPEEIGPENFVDFLIVKFRIPNYFGPEQARLDCILPGIMPYAQREIISKSLGIPAGKRRNSRIYYKAIKQNFPALTDFPLVKNSIVYPYGLTTISSKVYTLVSKTMKRDRTGESVINFFRHYESEIRKIMKRDEIREFKCYDEDAVMSIINDFYNGSYKRFNDLNWLLTFEVFRRKFHITSA